MKKKRSASPLLRVAASPRLLSAASPRPRVTGPSIVGIGSSAGGLEALEAFFKHVPKMSEMAFVVVQHMDPTHKGAMVELLQRATDMPVLQVKDRMRVQPGHVYVIPPNRDLSILHGVLHLIEPGAPRGLRLPIDFFFRSLADDQKERSVGVILSGMGSDGTLGLRAIKEHAGAAFVQAPHSAKFDGMPKSAVDAGLADAIAPVEELPVRIADYLKSAARQLGSGPKLADREQSALEKAIILLRGRTGHDFSEYKKSNLYRRIERRMNLHQLPKISDYVRYLSSNVQETDLLFKELLIGVTSFFRDPDVWELVKTDAIPALLADRPKGGTLRAWVAGCSTGEEPFSLAIIFKEALDKLKPGRDVQLQIFATDLDSDAIERARAAFYPASITADVSPERLRRFFNREERGYRVCKQIREMVIFARHNLIMDPPFTKLDFLSCRNLLIYLEPELQRRLLALFHYSLNPGGILLLGTAETLGNSGRLFSPRAGKSRLFRRSAAPEGSDQYELPPVFGRARTDLVAEATAAEAPPPAESLTALADRLLHQHYTPAAVLVTPTGDIVYVGGKTGKYLEPAAGKANWNIFAMARPGLDTVIHDQLRKALASETAVTARGVQVKTDRGTDTVDVTIQPLADPAELAGMALVVFADAARKGDRGPGTGDRAGATSRSARQALLESELRHAREEVQATREEMQSSQEELKSANEELQSTNEELQSTNEELTTSKEEMQSMNEELQTLNQELQAKLDELSRSSDDMKNLLNSTNIATLFLDDALNVRRFTTQSTKLFKLLPGDVGRPITDLSSDLDYPDLIENLQEVLRTLVFQERTVPTRDGRWYSMRIMPYRTQDDRIDGLVVTFSDVTLAKQLEASLREGRQQRQPGRESTGKGMA